LRNIEFIIVKSTPFIRSSASQKSHLKKLPRRQNVK
jgi:hypothetical protein